MFTKRQNEIINSAILLIAEGGIQKLTTKNLSSRLDISEPAIYRHFSSKLDILLGILDRFESNSKEKITALSESNMPAIAKIKEIFTGRCKEFAQNPPLAKVIFSEEIFQNEAELAQKVQGIMKFHQSEILKFIKTAQINNECTDTIPAEHIAHMTLGSLRLLVTKWRMTDYGFDIETESEKLWQSIYTLMKKER